MAKVTLKIEIDYESWFDVNREPKTKEDWTLFFQNYFNLESPVIGTEIDENTDMIYVNSFVVEVN